MKLVGTALATASLVAFDRFFGETEEGHCKTYTCTNHLSWAYSCSCGGFRGGGHNTTLTWQQGRMSSCHLCIHCMCIGSRRRNQGTPHAMYCMYCFSQEDQGIIRAEEVKEETSLCLHIACIIVQYMPWGGASSCDGVRKSGGLHGMAWHIYPACRCHDEGTVDGKYESRWYESLQ